MRPQMERTSLTPCLLLLLVISSPGDAWGQATECSPQILVKYDTAYKAVAKEPLKITCPIKHCGQDLSLNWCRLGNGTNCKPVDKIHGVTDGRDEPKEDEKLYHMFLHFGNISLEDAGKYRCHFSSSSISSWSHSITVSVTARVESLDNGNESNNSSSSMLTDEELDGHNWIPYFSICTIMLAVVLIVMVISFLCIYRCKGSQRSRNADADHYQGKDTKDRHGANTANHTADDRNSSHVHDNEKDRPEGSIIYVTLNHQSIQEDSGRKSIAVEDLTEYATIQVS